MTENVQQTEPLIGFYFLAYFVEGDSRNTTKIAGKIEARVPHTDYWIISVYGDRYFTSYKQHRLVTTQQLSVNYELFPTIEQFEAATLNVYF